MKHRKQLLAALIGTALAVGSTHAVAQQQPQAGRYGPGYHHGAMHGYGGYGAGYGMGPGMMGGYGGGYGMGPGMMGGYGSCYGAGPGMLGGYGGGAGYALNLTDEQREKIAKIQQELERTHWNLMGKMREEYAAGFNPQDEAAAKKTYRTIASLREQMFDASLAARKQMDAVLTKEQREQLRRN